jgi:hypothetical protein
MSQFYDDQVPRAGIGFGEWVAKEVYRCTKRVDELWDDIDTLQPVEVTQSQILLYNLLCDWLDFIETDAYWAYIDPPHLFK